MMRLDLLTLRLFVAVYDEASLTKAAARENISLSALSKRLSDLEKSLKTILFHRTKNRLAPTAAARSLASHVRKVMSDLDQLEVDLSSFSKGVKGRIRIWANTWAVSHYLPADLAPFMALHPLLQIDIQESISPTIVQAVADNAADIGIIAGDAVAPDLLLLPYRSDRLAVVMWKNHPLSTKQTIRLADMLDYDFIGPRRGSAIDSLFTNAAREVDFALKPRIRVSGFEAVCSMAEAKLGIGLVPATSVKRYQHAMEIAIRPLDEPWAVRSLNLCVASMEELTSASGLLLAHLRNKQPDACGAEQVCSNELVEDSLPS
jgi:DNA-binding transcriptional LysR family regulator